MLNENFDSHKYVRQAMAAGFTQDEAEFQYSNFLKHTVSKIELKIELEKLWGKIEILHFKLALTIIGTLGAIVTITEIFRSIK